MTLTHPCIITSSLMAGIRLADGGEICIEYATRPGSQGRTRYRWQINLPSGEEHSGDDLQSGCGGGGLRDGLESLLSFLEAAAESSNPAFGSGENSDLFPQAVNEWAYQNSDEIGMARLEIDENPYCIAED